MRVWIFCYVFGYYEGHWMRKDRYSCCKWKYWTKNVLVIDWCQFGCCLFYAICFACSLKGDICFENKRFRFLTFIEERLLLWILVFKFDYIFVMPNIYSFYFTTKLYKTLVNLKFWLVIILQHPSKVCRWLSKVFCI